MTMRRRAFLRYTAVAAVAALLPRRHRRPPAAVYGAGPYGAAPYGG